ncbi:MAG TPA: WbqC family protein, partial [bacterium]|nr:WbqC family protein [bacterium]
MMRSETDKTGIPGTVVTIHQPNFAPWPGYYHKMMMADCFVYLDNVPFSKNSFQNRNKIEMNGEARWLTVPVLTKGEYATETRFIRVNNRTAWRKKHLSTFRVNYGKTPFFRWVYPRIEAVYLKNHVTLV